MIHIIDVIFYFIKKV